MNQSKDHREVLTHAAIGRKLKKDAILSHWGILFASPLLALIIWAIYFEITVFFGERQVSRILFGAVAVVFTIEVVKLAYDIVRTIRAVNTGRYTVTEDVFCQLEIQELPWRRKTRHHHFDYIFSFASGKTYVTDHMDDTQTRLEYAVQFSKEGEKFYLVTADYNPDKILLIYPGVLFRYENR